MATITGMQIDYAASNFDVVSAGRVFKIVGSFTSDAQWISGSSSWPTWFVIEDGVRRPIALADITITPKNGPGETGGTFKIALESYFTSLNGLSFGDKVQFEAFNDATQQSVLTTPSITMYCFYPGTMIATPSGEAAVETLAMGDMVLRQDGTAAPVRWMGRSSVMPLFADRMKALPIRIHKDALDENVPSRDLLVSPDHGILVDGNLVQAGALVNDTSIIRETDVPPKFVYHHIELADHALVMAENTPAETFIDNVDRMAFDNWAEHESLYGEQPALVEMDMPRAKSHRQVPAETKKRLADRAIALGFASRAAA